LVDTSVSVNGEIEKSGGTPIDVAAVVVACTVHRERHTPIRGAFCKLRRDNRARS